MSNQNESSMLSRIFAGLVIVLALVVGILIYVFILGDAANFDKEGHPLKGNFLGMMYKGGFIVPILIALNIVVIAISIERFITLMRANGKGAIEPFVRKIKSLLASDQIDAAMSECDKQKGSLANVVKSGLAKYKMVYNSAVDKDAKIAAVQKDLEEATSLELPMLSKNLVILSTSASIGTLIGLIGTVLGMIRSFSAMAGAQPDTAQLSTGISEALINTATGIVASTIAIILYNYFSTKIDKMTYSMDEAGFSIVQTLNSK